MARDFPTGPDQSAEQIQAQVYVATFHILSAGGYGAQYIRGAGILQLLLCGLYCPRGLASLFADAGSGQPHLPTARRARGSRFDP